MQTLILVIHVMVGVALVAVVMLQRSEGGALGIGGSSGGGGGLMSGRGTANLLTRTTAILGAAFMTTSITLAILSGGGEGGSVLDEAPLPGIEAAPAPVSEAPVGPAVPRGN